MSREVDNVGALALPRPMLPRAFDGVGNGLKERVGRHAAVKTQRRITDVKKPVSVRKLARPLTDERGRIRQWHVPVPHQLKTTERFGNINATGLQPAEQTTLIAKTPSFSAWPAPAMQLGWTANLPHGCPAHSFARVP
jgi:hypothetical protein